MSDQQMFIDSVDKNPLENASLIVGLAATALAVLNVVGLALLSEFAAWVAGIGACLLAFGVFGGIRGLVGWGVGLVGAAALIATRSESLELALAVTAATALICMVVLLTADMSFALRRATVVSPVTWRGLTTVHAIAAVTGVVLSTVLVSVVLAVSWPGWLLLLPAVVLGGVSFAMARQASRYNAKMRPPPRQFVHGRMPPPPPPGIRATMPPPPSTLPAQFPPPRHRG